jgi:REP element-mobilizing transposase RayT
MARPPRLEIAGGLYHVMSRGNARRRIFFSDKDRARFLQQLQDNLRNYHVVLYAYVLMQNHFHILIKTERANLSRFMQRLNTSYALYVHYKRGLVGHVLQGRYKAKLVETDEYLVSLSRYIHLNPTKTRAVQALDRDGRAKVLEEYRWSSYPGYVSRAAAQDWVCYDLLREFGQSRATGSRLYRACVQACLLDDDRVLREAMHASRYAIGSETYIRGIEATLKKQYQGMVSNRDLALPREYMDLEVIDEEVSREFDIRSEDLQRHGRRAGEAKAFAMELACRFTGLNQRQIGEHYGNVTSMAVCMARRRFREDDHPEKDRLRRLLSKLERRILRRPGR